MTLNRSFMLEKPSNVAALIYEMQLKSNVKISLPVIAYIWLQLLPRTSQLVIRFRGQLLVHIGSFRFGQLFSLINKIIILYLLWFVLCNIKIWLMIWIFSLWKNAFLSTMWQILLLQHCRLCNKIATGTTQLQLDSYCRHGNKHLNCYGWYKSVNPNKLQGTTTTFFLYYWRGLLW